MIERTLILLKPDAVQRCVTGEIITRFEKVGLKIVGMKLIKATDEIAQTHYGEDITERRGEKVRNALLTFIREGPVVAMVLEGIGAIGYVRKMVGETEPKSASPGTIRADYAHVSFAYADNKNISIKNLIHASANQQDAEKEIPLWFTQNEIYEYSTVHDTHTL